MSFNINKHKEQSPLSGPHEYAQWVLTHRQDVVNKIVGSTLHTVAVSYPDMQEVTVKQTNYGMYATSNSLQPKAREYAEPSPTRSRTSYVPESPEVARYAATRTMRSAQITEAPLSQQNVNAAPAMSAPSTEMTPDQLVPSDEELTRMTATYSDERSSMEQPSAEAITSSATYAEPAVEIYPPVDRIADTSQVDLTQSPGPNSMEQIRDEVFRHSSPSAQTQLRADNESA